MLDNARILREFKMDDRAAYRALDSGCAAAPTTLPWSSRRWLWPL
ncbi:hypothetical protein NKG94_06430 [Micromonospora sp. M12]